MAMIHDTAVMRAEGSVDLRESEGCFVKSDGNGKLALCAATDTDAIGVVHVGGDKGDMTDYLLPAYAGIAGVKLNASPGTVVAGTKLVLAAGGTVKAGSTGTIVAVACEAGSGGQLVEAWLMAPTVVTA